MIITSLAETVAYRIHQPRWAFDVASTWNSMQRLAKAGACRLKAWCCGRPIKAFDFAITDLEAQEFTVRVVINVHGDDDGPLVCRP